MKTNDDAMKPHRRRFLQTGGIAAASLALGGWPLVLLRAADEASGKMKTGIKA